MSNKRWLFGLSLVAAVGFGGQASSAADGKMTAADELQWQEVAPGHPVKAVVLWGDRSKGEYAMLLKIPAGFSFPIHAHAGDYHGINLTGNWRHLFDGGEQRDLPPGSYVFQPARDAYRWLRRPGGLHPVHPPARQRRFHSQAVDGPRVVRKLRCHGASSPR